MSGMPGMGVGWLGDAYGYLANAQRNMTGFISNADAQNIYGVTLKDVIDQAWYSKNAYDEGRDNAWMPPLRDPGAIVLKIAGVLAIYPAVWLVIEAIKGLVRAVAD